MEVVGAAADDEAGEDLPHLGGGAGQAGEGEQVGRLTTRCQEASLPESRRPGGQSSEGTGTTTHRNPLLLNLLTE